jgi:site-specific DNA recombinase
MIRSVLYMRSSKDRSDVSIDAQRRALCELAHTRGIAVVGEYADAVESGKDDNRPGFQALLQDLRASKNLFKIFFPSSQ